VSARGYPGDGFDELIGGVNITPVVDVALTLLVVFMVTASFVLDRSIQVEVPRAASGEATPPSLVTIAIGKGGEVWLNGRPASLDDIPGAVEEARARRPGEQLSGFVSADVAAPYGRFAEAVDRLRLAGLTEIALDTQPARPPSP
jgi:biopolymer transport protein ExbD